VRLSSESIRQSFGESLFFQCSSAFSDKNLMRSRAFILAAFLFILPPSYAATRAGVPCPTLLNDTQDWLKLVNRDPKLKAHADKLLEYYLTGKTQSAEMELEIALLLRDLRDEGMLRPVLMKVLTEAKMKPGFPPIPGSDAEVVEQLYGMIDSELIARESFRPWADVTADQVRAVAASGKSEIGHASFLDELASLTTSVFPKSNL